MEDAYNLYDTQAPLGSAVPSAAVVYKHKAFHRKLIKDFPLFMMNPQLLEAAAAKLLEGVSSTPLQLSAAIDADKDRIASMMGIPLPPFLAIHKEIVSILRGGTHEENGSLKPLAVALVHFVDKDPKQVFGFYQAAEVTSGREAPLKNKNVKKPLLAYPLFANNPELYQSVIARLGQEEKITATDLARAISNDRDRIAMVTGSVQSISSLAVLLSYILNEENIYQGNGTPTNITKVLAVFADYDVGEICRSIPLPQKVALDAASNDGESKPEPISKQYTVLKKRRAAAQKQTALEIGLKIKEILDNMTAQRGRASGKSSATIKTTSSNENSWFPNRSKVVSLLEAIISEDKGNTLVAAQKMGIPVEDLNEILSDFASEKIHLLKFCGPAFAASYPEEWSRYETMFMRQFYPIDKGHAPVLTKWRSAASQVVENAMAAIGEQEFGMYVAHRLSPFPALRYLKNWKKIARQEEPALALVCEALRDISGHRALGQTHALYTRAQSLVNQFAL